MDWSISRLYAPVLIVYTIRTLMRESVLRKFVSI